MRNNSDQLPHLRSCRAVGSGYTGAHGQVGKPPGGAELVESQYAERTGAGPLHRMPGRTRATGSFHALNYRPRLPVAGAFTVGNVVFFRKHCAEPGDHPRLLEHESVHATQYALCLGLPFIPLYFLAAGYSWLRAGDPASRNMLRAAGQPAVRRLHQHPARRIMPALAAGLHCPASQFETTSSCTSGMLTKLQCQPPSVRSGRLGNHGGISKDWSCFQTRKYEFPAKRIL